MQLCQERWSRTAPPHLWELYGDLLEMALARGYCDDRHHGLIFDISHVMCLTLQMHDVIKNNAETATFVQPDMYAEALLTAHVGHKHGKWDLFNRVVSLSA